MKPERIVFIKGDNIFKNIFKKDITKYDFFDFFDDEIRAYLISPLRELIKNEHIYNRT